MANEPSATWKHSASKAPSSVARESIPAWQQGAPGTVRAPLIPRRRIALALTWVFFLSFCTALVWVATWVAPPNNVALFLMGAGYEDNTVFPANSAGQSVLRELALQSKKPMTSATRSSPMLRLIQDRIHEIRTDAPWDAGLETFSESTLLMMVSMHGGADIQGAFLLPTNSDARPSPAAQRLRMESILLRLKRISSSVKVVLVLDVTQMPAHWPLGMLHNDFVRGLEKEPVASLIREMPNLVVLVSSGPDQLSWTSHDWGKTIFGHFMIEGLRGGADLDGNQKIDALELYHFTHDRVQHWARTNRSAEQEPLLLPSGTEGIERARSIVLNRFERSYVAADPEKATQVLFTHEVAQAWRVWQSLRSMTPPPYVHAPHVWQQYQSELYQYESALRLADTATARHKKERLAVLERTIRAAGQIALRSQDMTLTMPAVAGDSEPFVDDTTEVFLKKWWETPKEEEARQVWEEGKKSLWKDRPLPLSAMSSWILQRLAQEKINGLPRAAQRLQLLRQGDRPLPAEAHWALMMQRDLPLAARSHLEVADLFTLALELRQLAERSAVAFQLGKYAYSEQVYPWIASALAKADRERQFGQDLMLGSQPSAWQQSRALLVQARKTYLQVNQQAESVRKALATRDRALSELPWYSHWLARRPVSMQTRNILEAPDLEGTIKDAWLATHELSQRLENVPISPPTVEQEKTPPSSMLLEPTHRTLVKLNALQQSFDQYLQSLLNVRPALNEEKRLIWLESEAALLVPQSDVPRRIELLSRQQRQSRQLLLESQHLKNSLPDLQRSDEAVKRQARREGEMALVWLGPAWFNRFGGTGEENYAQMQRRLEVASVEEKWYDAILKAGDLIGKRSRRMPLQVQRSLTPNPKLDKVNPGEFVRALQEADLIARRMEATQSLPDGLDPITEHRRRQLGNFMIAQLQRTFQDHWYDDNPGAEPYYCRAGRTFLADARVFLPAGRREHGNASLQVMLNSWDKKLQIPSLYGEELAIRDTTQAGENSTGTTLTAIPVVTSEREWQREYRIVPMRDSDEVPVGVPMLWIEDTPNMRVTEPSAQERLAVPLRTDADKLEQASVRFRLTSPLVIQAEEKQASTTFKERNSLKVRGLYRGQLLRLEAPVDIEPEPATIIRQFPLPQKASVAVRTNKDLTVRVGTNNSGIVFVLDCSGSMRPPNNGDYRLGRYYKAVEALRLVLQKIPKDTTVSVLTFGRAIGATRNAARAEQTIEHALNPTSWNPQEPRQLDTLISTLQGMEPWNLSPIMRTMLTARDDLKSIRGNKTIVVITDGYDNCFDKDLDLVVKYKDIPTLLKMNFDKSEIALHMVLFTPLDDEEKKSQELYRDIETYRPAGKIHSLQDIAKLAALLESVMRQRLNYWVDRTGQNVTVNEIPESGLDVSTSDKNDRWFGKGLPPGGHKVRVNVPERVEKSVLLHRGDLLLMDLVESPQGMMFERFLFSDDYPWKRRMENEAKDWRLTVLQNQLMEKNNLQMLISLEKTVDRRENVLEQIKPREAWIELQATPGAPPEFVTHWSHLAGYPAPAWSIEVPSWPVVSGTTRTADPILHVWWNPDEEARSGAELQVQPLFKEKNRPVVLTNEKNVMLESATMEDHRVEVRRGVFETRSCLVIRMHHEPHRPLITRLEGVMIAGAEHRLYAKASKYTGLYWFEHPQVTTVLASARLRIISVAAFKDEAERRGYSLLMRDLTAPEATDFRPRPPLELK